ncbi:MAG: preprotein translocase subunit SecG [Chitinophagaceae bacterium]|nr:MAG: preprotein translocase subunit SecG [Chitinophagaceae bacterium]
MTTLFLILIILCSVILGFFVLVQNPKGGGLAGNVGGLSNQFMGVKQTTDVLEKGTWIFAALIAVLCLTSTFFINSSSKDTGLEGIGTGTVQQRPATTPAPAPAPAPVPAQ